MQSAQVAALKSGHFASIRRLTQNRQCTHLSFVQAQPFSVLLPSHGQPFRNPEAVKESNSALSFVMDQAH